jgi:16S rRNA (guanine527-N7)-methyltransferase
VNDHSGLAERAATWAGVPWNETKAVALSRYAAWLVEEAIPGGGLGPAEAGRIWRRHLADSLLFAGCWRRRHPPTNLCDIGSGVGLPGIPLAIAWPMCAVTLLDRSGRRTALARRAVRVLGLDNVEVIQGTVEQRSTLTAMATSRAALQPEEALSQGAAVCRPGGVVVVAVSPAAVVSAPDGSDVEIVDVPVGVLDSRRRLLRMMVHGS